jgi:acetoacetyl-CoA synthetase
MPNLPETLVATLATTSLGAIWSSCSPDFGIAGVLDRFGQIAPEGHRSPPTAISMAARRWIRSAPIAGVLAQLPSVSSVIVVPYVAAEPDLGVPAGRRDAHACRRGRVSVRRAPKSVFERFPFDHPLFVMYSSGTTGKPKCIVHGAGGTLLQHLKEHHAARRPATATTGCSTSPPAAG